MWGRAVSYGRPSAPGRGNALVDLKPVRDLHALVAGLVAQIVAAARPPDS